MGAKLAAAYAGNVSSGAARWPEVKEVLESGEGGTDRSRQKKAILVSQAKAVAPYDSFDSTLLKCNFLTRVELKLAPGVLSAEGFMLYFPGSLCENLLELILKDSGLEKVPPGLKELQRIRSVDLSRNAIDVLPSQDVWKGVSGSLELLDLSFNKLTSIAELLPLTKLSQLKVDGNLLTSLNGVSWKESKQLATLSAVANQITEISEEVGEHAASLEYFELTDNKLTVVPPNIAECKKLKTLSIAGNPIKDQKVVKAAEKGMKDIKAYLSKIGGGKKR
jgi:Leucine-rich repeat (LRR) protein